MGGTLHVHPTLVRGEPVPASRCARSRRLDAGRALPVGVVRVGRQSSGDGSGGGFVDFFETTDMLLGSGDLGLSERKFQARVVAMVSKKWGHADGGVEGVVVGEFGYREKVVPVVLSVVAESPKVLFEDLIDPLRLAVRLGVKGRREIGSDVQESFDLCPPLGSEA